MSIPGLPGKGCNMIRIMLVDDHELVRVGLKHVLDRHSDIQVVGEAADGETALRLSRDTDYDVMLLDISMPGLSGFEITRRLTRSRPEVRIIILTVHAETPYPSNLLESGASGYLTKDCGAEELVKAIRAVHKGLRYVGGDIAQQLALALLPGADQSPFEGLTAREMEVLLMLVQGHTAAEIAETMSLSAKTVSSYKYRIYDKLDVRTEVGLLHLAFQHGIVGSDLSGDTPSRTADSG